MCKCASSTGVLALLVALIVSMGESVYGEELVQSHFVRATKYHRTDPGVDPWTARGQTSTQLRLPKDDRIVTNPNKIGNVAVDPRLVPEGSLVFETQTGMFFVSTTGGTAVIDRRSSRAIARMRDLCQKHYNAPVFDFYFPEREIVEDHFTYCFVVPHDAGDSPNNDGRAFRLLNKESQERRLTPGFWIERLEGIQNQLPRHNREQRKKLDVMIGRLREMYLYQNSLT